MANLDRRILFDLAEREIHAGSFDSELFAACMADSRGVQFKARELYWERRALAWETESKISHLSVTEFTSFLIARQETAEFRKNRRSGARQLALAIAILLSFAGLFITSVAALSAIKRSTENATLLSAISGGFLAASVLLVVIYRRGRARDLD